MRSPIGPMLIVLGLATTVVLVLVLFQTIALRSDLDAAREELRTLRLTVEEGEAALTEDDLATRLDELEARVQEWLVTAGASDPGDPSTDGASSSEEVLDRIDDVLAAIEALDRRVDEICDNVPVC